MLDRLAEDNFVIYAAKHYDNSQCYDTLEFYDDLKRFKYIKRLFGKYQETGELKERLILNHVIILYNVFGDAATRMLFMKLDSYHSYLKPFLVMLGRLPDRVHNIGFENTTYHTVDIPLDKEIVAVLRNI